MSLTQWITDSVQQYAYQPEMVYLLIIVIMLITGFGVPIPEEVTIITTSLMAYMAMNPDIYPPPTPDARGVNVYILMVVCFVAVFLSDLVVYGIGRRLGRNLNENKWFQKIIEPKSFKKVKFWTQKYGAAAVGVFRFLPGLRFPGHIACGAFGIPAWKFMTIDGIVILLTIPTQVYLIAHYGEEIINFIEKFRYILAAIILGVLIYLGISVYRNLNYIKQKNLARSSKKQTQV